MDDFSTRVPPHNRDAERSVLGSLLRDNLIAAEVFPLLKADDFYAHAHQIFYRGIAELIQKGGSADPVTICQWLHESKQTADIGGNGYIVELWDAAPSVGNAKHYAKIVKNASVVRQMIHICGELQSEAWDGTTGDELLAKAEHSIYSVSRGSGSIQTQDWSTCLAEASDAIDKRSGRHKEGEVEEGLKMGWEKVDKLTAGMHKGELIILAARPSVGKTLVALNIIDNVAAQKKRVFFASIEQGRKEIVFRVLSRRSGVNSYKFRDGITERYDANRVVDASAAVSGYKIWINDASNQSLGSIISESRRIQMKHGLDLIVIDYLGLINTMEDRRSGNRVEEVSRLTRGLKELAREMDIPIMVLAQLNRGSENRTDRVPRLADLRESGSIEQDADTVFLLHKPEPKDYQRDVDSLIFYVEKQRNGPVGYVGLEHHKRTFDIRQKEGELHQGEF